MVVYLLLITCTSLLLRDKRIQPSVWRRRLTEEAKVAEECGGGHSFDHDSCLQSNRYDVIFQSRVYPIP